MADGNPPTTGFAQLKDAMHALAASMTPVTDVARAVNDYADHLASGKPALLNINDQLKSLWTSEAGGALTTEFGTNLGPTFDNTIAILRSAADKLDKVNDSMQQLNGFSIGNALNPVGTPTSLAELEERNPPAPTFSEDLAKMADDQLVAAGQNLIQTTLQPVLDDAFNALDLLTHLGWPGRQGADPSKTPDQRPKAPAGPHGPGPGPGGPKAPKAPSGPGPGAKAPGDTGDTGSTGDQGGLGASTGDPGTGDLGSTGSNDPTSLGDPNSPSSDGTDQTPTGPNIPDPSTFDPENPPTDPGTNNPDQPTNVPINVPQLAGNPTVTHLPPDTSIKAPDIKVPDPINLSSPNSSTGGPIDGPLLSPPGVVSNQPKTGGTSNSLPSTGTPTSNAPKSAGPPGEAAATTGANRGGTPFYPPPMGGMGGAGRGGGGGVRPGTAENPGGPELGGLGAATNKPVEEIGVPARLRGRSAAGAGRPTRAPRRRGRKPSATTTGSATDDRDEVLDEHLWRVEPPAVSDE